MNEHMRLDLRREEGEVIRHGGNRAKGTVFADRRWIQCIQRLFLRSLPRLLLAGLNSITSSETSIIYLCLLSLVGSIEILSLPRSAERTTQRLQLVGIVMQDDPLRVCERVCEERLIPYVQTRKAGLTTYAH